MFIIVGLGNPGREYDNTRHNVGFRVLEKLAAKENISVLEKRHKAIIGKGMIAGEKCILAKPQTYMNLSGESVRELVNFYKVDEKAELIVISDDISLEPGQIRIRKKGSAGGHNGLKNIIANLGHDTFIRVKMGVGEKPAGWDLVDYVLGRFSTKDGEAVDEAADRAARAIRMIIVEGPDAAMNRYNGSTKEGKTLQKGKNAVNKGEAQPKDRAADEGSTELAKRRNAAERDAEQSQERGVSERNTEFDKGRNVLEKDTAEDGESSTLQRVGC
ncbi:MAG TPA: aminoacyl-tRNA hydrolase [Lachnospiraceae bacterium]|nr:aminoacyl-tRNA hydrolase [Lachnospiraceae bacterium]